MTCKQFNSNAAACGRRCLSAALTVAVDGWIERQLAALAGGCCLGCLAVLLLAAAVCAVAKGVPGQRHMEVLPALHGTQKRQRQWQLGSASVKPAHAQVKLQNCRGLPRRSLQAQTLWHEAQPPPCSTHLVRLDLKFDSC